MTHDPPTVLLTGAAGLLGTWLRRSAPSAVNLVSVSHRRPVPGDGVMVDLRDCAAVRACFEAVMPQVVIHAAYARDRASIVDATHHVAEVAGEVGADVILVSSEAVFSGDGTPRAETSVPDPVWDYGRWKAEAEDIVSGADPGAAIVRLPLIVSHDPEDHILSDVRAACARDERSVWFTDEIRQPAQADELAGAIWAIVGRPPASRAGVWHLPGPERLSRCEIAARAVELVGLDRSSITGALTPPDARRPRDLHLTGARAQRQIGWSPRRVHQPAISG
jgi:dTDP-4-dehydrorhamnose reductase